MLETVPPHAAAAAAAVNKALLLGFGMQELYTSQSALTACKLGQHATVPCQLQQKTD